MGRAFWPTSAIADTGRTRDRILSYPVASFSDLTMAWGTYDPSEIHVLDVRHRQEWKAGHIAGAEHVPVQELADAKGTLPTGQVSGSLRWRLSRRALAASLLSSWGASPILIDDSWENALWRACQSSKPKLRPHP